MSTSTITDTAVGAFTMTLPSHLVPAMAAKVDRANRKAERNGLGRPFALVTVGASEVVETIYGARVTRSETELTLTGDAPSLPGWDFAATVDWSLESPVLNVSPFYAGPVLPRPADATCEHCGLARSRNRTYIVTGPDGAFRQVGSGCLTIYTGIPVGWIALAEDLAEADPDAMSWGAGERTYSVASVLGLGVRIVDACGYVSTGKADELGQLSTRDRFEVAHDGARDARAREIQESNNTAMATRSRSDDDVAAEVAAILAWAAGLGDADSDYLRNVSAILADGGWIGPRHLGYALSAVASYRRDRDRLAKRVAERASRPPVPTGRVLLTGTVLSVELRATQWGETVKARVALDSGSAVWGTLPRAIMGAVAGDRVEFTATVEASDNDPGFGFYSRPSKARML